MIGLPPFGSLWESYIFSTVGTLSLGVVKSSVYGTYYPDLRFDSDGIIRGQRCSLLLPDVSYLQPGI